MRSPDRKQIAHFVFELAGHGGHAQDRPVMLPLQMHSKRVDGPAVGRQHLFAGRKLDVVPPPP
jgi:hypothetical protein